MPKARPRKTRSILDHLPDVVLSVLPDGEVTYINRAGPGRTVEQVLGSTACDYVPPEAQPRLWEALNRVFRRGEPSEFEAPALRPDGQTAHYACWSLPIRRRGLVVEALVVATEVAPPGEPEGQPDGPPPRRRREMEDFVENAAVGMHWVGPDGTILWTNRAELDLLGYAPEEYLGHHVAEFHVDPAQGEGMLRRLAEGETLREYETTLRCKDGSVRHVLIDASGWFEDGQFVYTRCFLRDVTESHRASEALRENERRLRFILEAARVGTWEWDVPSGMVRWSENMEEIHGLPPRAFGGTIEEVLEDVHPEDREAVEGAISSALDGGRDLHVEYRLARREADERPEGDEQWVEGTGRVVRDEAGQPLRIVGVCRDITVRKQAEAAMRQQDRLASVGTLAAGLAHEVNNPLSAMLTSARVAERALGQAEGAVRVAECLSLIQAEGERIRQIVKNVARFAKQGASLKAPCDLGEITKRACERVGPYAQTRGISLECDVPAGLPQIVANATEIEQVLTNLLSNAIEASAAGATVHLRVRRTTEGAQVEVEDQGRGMSEAEQEQMFDPFYTGREGDGGTGLGLSIAHGIVAEHGGRISVRSTPGEGTTMTVTLPLAVSGNPER